MLQAATEVMDRLPAAKSASSLPRHESSSVGASSSPTLLASRETIDKCDSRKIREGNLSSGSDAEPAVTAATDTLSPSARGGSSPSCRPYDRGDLLKRLSTFNSSKWSVKPKVAGPVACATRGWVNVDFEKIACEACDGILTFPTQVSKSKRKAAESFGHQLEDGHKGNCPWKGNYCAESLAELRLTPVSVILSGYEDRRDALLQLSGLPVVSSSAIEQMKLTRGLQIELILSKGSSLMYSAQVERAPVEGSSNKLRDPAAGSAYYQAQCLISLCGWEPRLLPHVVDIEEHFGPSGRKLASIGPSPDRPCVPAPSGLLDSSEDKNEKAFSAALDCSLCGASVLLDGFSKIVHPLNLTEEQRLINRERETLQSFSAASGIDGWYTKSINEKPDGEVARDATIAEEVQRPFYRRTLDVNPILLGKSLQRTEAPACKEIMINNPPVPRELEGSEMRRPVGSYESFGPGTAIHGLDDGGSTVDRPQNKYGIDSVENDIEVGRRMCYVSKTSKCKRSWELLTADQFSYGLVSTVPGCTTLVEGTGNFKKARLKVLQDRGDNRIHVVQSQGSLRASSVIALDTCYDDHENSMESVDNTVNGSDVQGIAISMPRSEGIDLEGLSTIEQVQQSTCHSTGFQHGDGRSSEPDACMSSQRGHFEIGPVGMEHGFSLGTSGGSIHMCASHEAEIHGTEMSAQQTESVDDCAELLTEVTENRMQIQEFGSDHSLIGDFIPEDVEQRKASDPLTDSHKVLSSGSFSERSITIKRDHSVQGGVCASQDRDSPGISVDQWRDTNQQAVIVRSEVDCFADAPAVDRRAQNSMFIVGKGKGSENRSSDRGEFDPISQHHHFCPWINGDVADTASSDLSVATGLCGWQLTVDALYAGQVQGNYLAAPVESGSAASMHKACRVTTVTT